MRKGHDILKKQLGLQLAGGIVQSYFYNGQLFNKINVTYLKFNSWLHITTSDETAILEIVDDQPVKIESWTDNGNNTADYPLTKIYNEFPVFEKFIGKTLVDFSELVLPDDYEITCGLKLYFGNNDALILYTDNDDNSYYSFDNKVPLELIEK